MDHFEITNMKFRWVRIGLGIFFIIIALLWYIASHESTRIIVPLFSVFFALYGIYQITNGFGLERSWIKTGDHFIIIKWIDLIRPVQIHDTGIVKISLERSRIIIFRKSGRPLKLNLSFLEREQKKEVYDFLINYSKQRNISLEKYSSTLL